MGQERDDSHVTSDTSLKLAPKNKEHKVFPDMCWKPTRLTSLLIEL